MRKGIILAGGTGSRLYPLTKVISKHLLPVYDKPMIYYPLSTLMLAGIKDILLISTENDLFKFQTLFGDGSRYGINISYKVQTSPKGIADAFIIGKKFIGNENCALVLGDNLFYGNNLMEILQKASGIKSGATVFAYPVKDPENYGVVEFNENGRVLSLEEKPNKPRSSYAVTGLYFYDNEVIEIANKIKPSKRGELEVTSINNHYLANDKLNVEIFGRGMAWLDTGTYGNLLQASLFIETIEKRQGLKLACLEEIAYRMGYISKNDLIVLAESYGESDYGRYLLDI
jgi:glucose-1-phosphate thymidylyltransferase